MVTHWLADYHTYLAEERERERERSRLTRFWQFDRDPLNDRYDRYDRAGLMATCRNVSGPSKSLAKIRSRIGAELRLFVTRVVYFSLGIFLCIVHK